MAAEDPSKPVQVSGSEEDRPSLSSQTVSGKISVENADKYVMGMCRAVFNMLRLAISAEMALPRDGVNIQKFYLEKMRKGDLDKVERPIIALIGYLRLLFPSNTGQVFEHVSEQKRGVHTKLREITTAINSHFKNTKSSLYNKRIEEFPSQSFKLTRETSRQLSHALMDQLLMGKDISELRHTATSLELFVGDHGGENSEATKILEYLCEMSKRKESYGTHEQHVADDVKAYNSFKKLMTERLTAILDQDMMEFPDYDKEIEKDQKIQEFVELVKTESIEGSILQKINANLARGSKITPQILVEMYLGLFICKRHDDYGTVEESFLKKEWVNDRWVYRNLAPYQVAAFDLYNDLKGMAKDTNLAMHENNNFDALLLSLQNNKQEKRKSEFFKRTVDDFMKGRPIPVLQLRTAVLHEALVEVSDGLGYLLYNTPDMNRTFYKNMWKLLNIVNASKHKRGIDAASDITYYFETFEALVCGFFCPELRTIYPEENMIKETEECKEIYNSGSRLFDALKELREKLKELE